MIYIREIVPPRKFSGISSFLISFQYKPEIVDAIKALPLWYYHKKDFCWEIPIDCLTQALDTLTFIDDIQLIPADETGPVSNPEDFELTETEIGHFRCKPFQHQIEGINFGLDPKHPKWLLLDSMGLGKTNEIIWYAETLKNRGLIDHAMIICGVDSLRQNWKNEIQKFSNESCRVLGEKFTRTGTLYYATIPERAKELKEPIDAFFVIINAATLRHDEVIDAFQKSKNKFGLIAVDEIHRFATKTSQQGSNLLKLKAPYKVGATGTLLINSPISCYMPLAWTENDFSTLTNFKAQYCVYGGFGDKQIVDYKNLETLREELNACMIRRTLEQVRSDMPPKTITYELVEMSDQHRKFYEAIKDGVKAEADKIHLNANNLLALTTRLRQATSCPSVLTSQTLVSSKVERCVEIAEELLDQGEKVVILSGFVEAVNALATALDRYNPLVGTGEFSEQVVQQRVDQFQADPNARLFIGTHQKMGTGFTLNAGNYMICLDTQWTWASFSQSTDRIWRVTNDKPAFITVLACADSIDERVRDLVEFKKDLADYVIDGVQNHISESLANELLKIIREL